MVALVIVAPVEKFMNVLLKVEKAVSAATDVVMVSSDGDVLTQPEKKLLSDSFQQNALLISARPQWAAIEMWMRLLSIVPPLNGRASGCRCEVGRKQPLRSYDALSTFGGTSSSM